MELVSAIFLERVNRFVVKAKIEDKEILAYLPNPGRLWELLLPGRKLLLTKSPQNTYKYVVIATLKDGIPVLLHTHLTNKYIKELILAKKIPFLSKYEIVNEEPKVGKGRLDFWLKDPSSEEELFLEVKTCTLFGSKLAMFPDAETKRGTRHLYELAELASQNKKAGCLFVVMNPAVKFFLPAYHIDFAFTKAFIETCSKVNYWAIGIAFNQNFSEIISIKNIIIPRNFLKTHFGNWGAYLLIIKLNHTKVIHIGKQGSHTFIEGFYVYVGSAKKNLLQRLERYKRGPTKVFWHIDYLLKEASLCKIIPFVTKTNIECELANHIYKIAENFIPKFGASDCSCLSHLYYFSYDPLKNPDFINLINLYRLEKPLEALK